MVQKENTPECLEQVESELAEEEAGVPVRDDSEYVERSRGTRIFAWVLLVLVVTGVILYYLWIAGVLHT